MAEPDYIAKTYTALKENLEGFNKTEQEFRDNVLSDPAYRGNVHKALSENLQGFQRTPEEFDSLVGVKKKRHFRPGGYCQRAIRSIIGSRGIPYPVIDWRWWYPGGW